MAVVGDGTEPDRPDRGAPPDVRDVSFPVSRRGYDRGAVDAYVDRVGAVIDELEATRSPEAAVKNALRDVGEKTSAILEQAGETAEEITVAARQNAEANRARAEKEAHELVANARTEAEAIRTQAETEAAERLERAENELTALREEAEARLRELEADTDAVRNARRALLDDIRELARKVEQAAQAADKRFPPPQEADATEELPPESESGAQADGNGVEPTPARTTRTQP